YRQQPLTLPRPRRGSLPLPALAGRGDTHRRAPSPRLRGEGWGEGPLSQLGEILLPEFGVGSPAGSAALGFGGAQFDAADLAGDGLRQFGEFEPPHPFERCEAGADV